MSDLDKQRLTRKEYNELEESSREVLDTAMAHSREIFGIQMISHIHTSQVPGNKKVDGKAVRSKNRHLAAEAHPDRHVRFCKKYNIEDSAGILKNALKNVAVLVTASLNTYGFLLSIKIIKNIKPYGWFPKSLNKLASIQSKNKI
jgi:hypothetical protein